ncbi:MAG: substrate-binding domain-containing protein [Alphaproteobacteria bacterium]|nr:substrate-binding domain-containing protein [Alphaproteobacteria bacterium]
MRANAAAGLVALLLGLGSMPALAQPARPAANDIGGVFPPWQHGANSDVRDRGLEFTVPQIDDLADFHGDIADPKLVLYVGGNYFFAMAPLAQAFEKLHPEYRGRLYWETIPPGLLAQQIRANGVITSGNMTWTAKADVYLAGLRAVRALVKEGLLEDPVVPYVTNTLTIMVAQGNPHGITGLRDLADPKLRLAMPNPAFEGIGRQIQEALRKAGGEALVRAVYEAKVHDGSTVLTRIHHRQTPLFLLQGAVDAGITWQSEALFQEQIGQPIGHVEIPASVNATGIYAGAIVKGAAHREAGRAWLDFIRSPEALAIFARYGFKPYQATQ